VGVSVSKSDQPGGDMRTYTVNVNGDKVQEAKSLGLHAYYADGVTAIEVPAENKWDARSKATIHGFVVLYVFE
jgi:hypothetical protein